MPIWWQALGPLVVNKIERAFYLCKVCHLGEGAWIINNPNYKTMNHNHCSVGTAELDFWELSIESTIFGRLWHEE